MRHGTRVQRRGATAVLAMLYLVLFSTMAVGFYAAVNTSVQVAASDQTTSRARLASESGMAFMKYHFANLDVPPATPETQLFAAVYDRLCARLDGYPNMKGHTVGVSADGNFILIPGGNDTWIDVDNTGLQFRIVIEKLQNGAKLRTTVLGRNGTSVSRRAVRLDYAVAEKASDILDYGVASRSRIHLNSNAKILGGANPDLGSVLSTAAPGVAGERIIVMDGNAQITGEVSFSHPEAATSGLFMSSSATIGNDPPAKRTDTALLAEYVNYDVPEPLFPTINTDLFKPFAGNLANGGTTIIPLPIPGETKFSSGSLRNVLIKASTHPDHWVVFDSNMTIDGVVYIETPNKVRFDSNVVIRGAVVVQSNPTHDYTRNSLVFNSNVKIQPIESLAGVNTTYFPKELTDLTGASILAPGFDLVMNSNFGTTGGAVVADRIAFDSNAVGTIRGSVINLADTMVEMDSNANITIQSLGTSEKPAGLYFGSRYTPLPDTYAEVRP